MSDTEDNQGDLEEVEYEELSAEEEDSASEKSDDSNAPVDETEQPDDYCPLTTGKTTYIVPIDKRVTSHIMSEWEITEAIVIRATQISNGQQALCDVTGMNDAREMALKEIDEGVCPLVLRRRVGSKVVGGRVIEYVEDFDVNTMGKPINHD